MRPPVTFRRIRADRASTGPMGAPSARAHGAPAKHEDFGFGKKRQNIAYDESASGLISGFASAFPEDLHRDLETSLETGKAPIWTMGALRKRANKLLWWQLSNGPNVAAAIRSVKVRPMTHALGRDVSPCVRGPVPGFVPHSEDRP